MAQAESEPVIGIAIGNTCIRFGVYHNDWIQRQPDQEPGGWKLPDYHSYDDAELLALRLRSLKKEVVAHVGQPVSKAVIAVPADAPETVTSAVRSAAEKAGLLVMELLQAPVAALIAHELDKEAGYSLVFHCGETSTSASLLRGGPDGPQVVAVASNNKLGGQDVDELLRPMFLCQFEEDTGRSMTRYEVSFELRHVIEKTKEQTSGSKTTIYNLILARASRSNHSSADAKHS